MFFVVTSNEFQHWSFQNVFTMGLLQIANQLSSSEHRNLAT